MTAAAYISAKDLSRVRALKQLATEHEAVAAEIRLADEQLPIIAAREKELQGQIEGLAPTVLLAFDDEVMALVNEWRKAEIIAPALSASKSRLQTRHAISKADLERETKSLLNILRSAIKQSLPPRDRFDSVLTVNDGAISAECCKAFERFAPLWRLTDPAQKALALVDLFAEFGCNMAALEAVA